MAHRYVDQFYVFCMSYDDVIKWKKIRVTGHLCGEFTGHRWIPRTKASDAELWCFLWSGLDRYKRLSKEWWDWWFEMSSRQLWRHCNELSIDIAIQISFRHVAEVLFHHKGPTWPQYPNSVVVMGTKPDPQPTLTNTETERSSGWQPLYSLDTLKLGFSICSECQGCQPDDLCVSM